ncbi:anti-sigma B factor RsbW [Pseudalkalibacillus caeni]|uniref:Serine-protein kinase RsbW n=2 Tax=Exobacillus caeni TaxID=2574798 RepID=A0A5R9F0H6_9BACL|nr:anti-sigma B factor RsbW [Pseudalkalibacillus caeni]TLS34918.1 anti-sigma B factor RsbW [Pseudalkalibacillus caeni]
MTSDFVEMKIPAEPEYVGVVRLTVSGIANRMGYSYDDIEDIKIAVSEACTNAVNHAYPEEEVGQVTVGFGVYEDRLEVMVLDRGKSFNFEEIQGKLGPVNSEKSIEQLNEGGLGLFLIESLMDKVEISGEDGVVVMMTKFLHRDGVEVDASKVSSSPQQ